MPKELLSRIPELGATETVEFENKIVHAKFFSPYVHFYWYAVEYDPKEGRFFGFVNGQEKEWGYFMFDELANAKYKGVPAVERDCYFTPKPFKNIRL